MLMGYETGQWIQLGIWLLSMIVLFTGGFAVSCIITNKTLHKKRNKLKRNKKIKSYFIDVA